MRKLLENIEKRSIAEGLEIGKTIENGNLRIHRYRPSIEVTDLTNAGKRGKICRQFVIFDLDYAFRNVDNFDDKLEDFENKLSKATDYDSALKYAKSFIGDANKDDKFDEREIKGIGVELGKKTIENSDMEITYSSVDFGVYDKRLNKTTKIVEKVWAAIPPVSGAKTEIAKFYKWISNEFTQKRVSKMNYNQVLDAMNKEGIRYHTFDMFY